MIDWKLHPVLIPILMALAILLLIFGLIFRIGLWQREGRRSYKTERHCVPTGRQRDVIQPLIWGQYGTMETRTTENEHRCDGGRGCLALTF